MQYQSPQYDGPPQTARVAHHIFRHQSGRLVIFATIVALAGLAASAASLAFFLSYRSTTQAQIAQLQQAVSNAQAASQASIGSQAAEIRRLNAALSALAQFSTVCSQYLTGPGGGPATFYFPCTQTRP